MLGSSARDLSRSISLSVRSFSAEVVAARCQFVKANRSSAVGRSLVCFDRLAQPLLNERGELTGKRHDRFPVGELGVS